MSFCDLKQATIRFDVADMLAAGYHDILARMHHNHSTTFPLTSLQTSVNITLLALYLPNRKCPNRTRFGWATLHSSDWTSFPRPFLPCSCPWHNIYKYYIYMTAHDLKNEAKLIRPQSILFEMYQRISFHSPLACKFTGLTRLKQVDMSRKE